MNTDGYTVRGVSEKRVVWRGISMTSFLFALMLSMCQPAPDWELVTRNAGWQPRDSQGEVVFNNRLWIMGGWFDSFSAPPRDVWSSPDGKSWSRTTSEAPWRHSDLPMSVTFRGKMWLMGGWADGRLKTHSASAQVWNSDNGSDWKLVTEKAGWSPRLAAGVAVHDDKLWIIGGTENYYFGTDKSIQNDVWCSGDGKTWTCVTKNAPWKPRAYHQVVAHAGKLWVLGGGKYQPGYQAFNDVWCSENGKDWTCITEKAPWNPRLWFSAVAHRDHLWVVGGWSNNPAKNWGDVWCSKDGKTWKELITATRPKERHEHSALVFQDAIWMLGGHAQPLCSEVWRLGFPEGWQGEK